MTVRPQTSSKDIVLTSREEVQRLCREFGCGEVELLHAVRKAGPDADSVRAFLNRPFVALVPAQSETADGSRFGEDPPTGIGAVLALLGRD